MLDGARYVALTTFRRDGTPVVTPVWTVRHRGGWACTTGATSGKVKRLRRTDRVEVAPCSVGGTVAPDAPRFAGVGRVVVDRDEFAEISRAVTRKYWVVSPLMDLWAAVGRLLGRRSDEGAVAWTVDGPAG